MKHHFLIKGFMTAALAITMLLLTPSPPEAQAAGESYMLEVRTSKNSGSNDGAAFTFYGTDKSGAEVKLGEAKSVYKQLQPGSSVNIPITLSGDFTEITRMDINAYLDSAGGTWKPELVRLVRCDAAPSSYHANYSGSKYNGDADINYSYTGASVCEYKNTKNYTFRSNETVSVMKHPVGSAQMQNVLTSSGEKVTNTPTWLVVTVDSSDEIGGGLVPEHLALTDIWASTRSSNSRDVQFTLDYRDEEGFSRTQTYYPMCYVYFASQYFEKHPGKTPNPADPDFQKYIANPVNFDSGFNIGDLTDAKDFEKARDYVLYQTAYYKYNWFFDGTSDSFIIPVPSYAAATSYKLTNSGIEDSQWKITGLTLHSLSSYSAAYSESYMHMMGTFTEPPLYSANLGAGVTIVPTGSHSGSFTKGGQNNPVQSDTYIVTVETDSASGQNGSNGKLKMDLTYLNKEGLKKTVSIDVNKEVAAFIGSTKQQLLRPGGKDSFPIQLGDASAIVSANLTLSAPPGSPYDDWQMKSVTITRADSIDRRHALNPGSGRVNASSVRKLELYTVYAYGLIPYKSSKKQKNFVVSSTGYGSYADFCAGMCVNTPLPGMDSSKVYKQVKRNVSGYQCCSPIQWTRDFTGKIAADYTSPLFLQQNSPSGKIKFTDYQNPGATENLEEDKPLTSIPLSMDYSDVSGNLQLSTSKCTYTVNVHVADVADAGSTNNFFFQLVFANGTSGVVLANQQLEGDAFRQGMMSSFTIDTNQNYGAVKSIRIYTYNSTSSAGGSQEFDKLDIEKIEIIRSSTQGISSSWTIDGIGWIDTGYHEQDVEGSSTNMIETKNTDSSASVCREYSVTSLQSSMDFMVLLKTGDAAGDATDNGVIGNLTYIDTSGTYRVYTMKMDELIHTYNNNSSYAFRQGKYDRFRFSLTDVKEIVSLQMVLGGSDNWTCDSAEIYRISNVGPVYVSANGEYIRDCNKDFITRSANSPLRLTSSQNTATFIFDTNQNMDITFTVDENEDIVFNTESTIPPSQDETLNFYVFPSAQYGKVLNSPLQLVCKYTTIYGGAYMQISETIPKGQYLENGAMYLRNVPVTNLDSINGVALSTANTDTPGISHVLIERVRKGEIIDSSYVDFAGTYLTNPFYCTVDPTNSAGSMEQRVTFSLPASDDFLRLSGSNDVGVSLRCESAVDPEVTLKTPYTYLTKQQITTLSSGDLTSVVLQQPYVGKITGISIATNGDLDFTVENVMVTNTDSYGQLLSMSGSGEGFSIGKISEDTASYIHLTTPEAKELYKDAPAPVSITFDTADSIGAGTTGPVEAEIVCAVSDAPPSDYAMNYSGSDSLEEEDSGKEDGSEVSPSVNRETVNDSMAVTTVYIPDLMKYVSKNGDPAAAFTQNSKTTVNLLLNDIGTILEIRLKIGKNDPWQLNAVSVARTLADGTVETGIGAPDDWIDDTGNTAVNVRIPALRDEIAEAKAAEAKKAKEEAEKAGTAEKGKKETEDGDTVESGGSSGSGSDESGGGSGNPGGGNSSTGGSHGSSTDGSGSSGGGSGSSGGGSGNPGGSPGNPGGGSGNPGGGSGSSGGGSGSSTDGSISSGGSSGSSAAGSGDSIE